MAPPEAEWMLWAKRLRDENKLLLQRIDAKPESSAIDLLAEEVRTLATTIQHLQQDNHALRDRIHELERDALDQKQVAGDEFRGLERAMADMKNELSRTTELVQTLREEEGLYQTQMQKKTTPRAVARITYRTRAAASKAFSQATTTDDLDSVPGGQETRSSRRRYPSRRTTSEHYQHQHQHQPQVCYNTTTTTPQDGPTPQESREAQARDRYTALEAIGIEPQGNKTLEEYFRSGASSVVRAVQLYESRAAKAFVCGVRDKHCRMELWERLTERGWTWQQMRKEMQWMLEEEKRRKGRKVSMEL